MAAATSSGRSPLRGAYAAAALTAPVEAGRGHVVHPSSKLTLNRRLHRATVGPGRADAGTPSTPCRIRYADGGAEATLRP
ncbi:hypothetical protein [Nonomuraea sp. NPDC049400]|uniref:hypothetical protein n=1 Tax=Nonomuraea sp. NPDC049400 TaxID=3364352 RepID=UPI0037AC8BE0